MTKLTRNQRIALAVILGGTNAGLTPPPLKDVEGLMQVKDNDLENAVHFLWAKFAENEEMLEMFLDECKHWYNKTLKTMSAEKVQETWGKYHPELEPVFKE